MKKIICIVLGVMVSVVALVVIAGMYKFNYLANLPGYDVDGNKIPVIDFVSCVRAEGTVSETDPRTCLWEEQVFSPETVLFTGVFERYNTGCYADGECYAVIDGKKVTTLVGWAQETVGSFANPDIPTGTPVEVYAEKVGDGQYSLYGSSEYYIR